LRCRKFGVKILVHPKVVLYHAIGINTHSLGPLTVVVSSHERCYYIMRNSVILFRKSHVPKLFAFKSFVSILIHQIAQYFYVNNRSKYIFMGLIGLLHGLRGIKGQKPVGKKAIIKAIP
jgi:rhamnosyltransferase